MKGYVTSRYTGVGTLIDVMSLPVETHHGHDRLWLLKQVVDDIVNKREYGQKVDSEQILSLHPNIKYRLSVKLPIRYQTMVCVRNCTYESIVLLDNR